MSKTSPAKHLGYLDGMRGMAALFVVMHHSFLQVNGQIKVSGLLGHALNILLLGRYAVDVFIVLSGFCLMLPVASGDGTIRGGAWEFFKRRAKRILPTYYLALIFSWALAVTIISRKTGTHWDDSLPVSLWGIISHLLLIHDLTYQDFTINHVFWSIAVEWRIYFLFPFLVWMWRTIGGLWTTFASICASIAVFQILTAFKIPDLTTYYIGLFAMGMLASSIAFSSEPNLEKLRRLPWNWITAAAAVVVLVITPNVLPRISVPRFLTDEMVGIWTSCLLVTTSFRPSGWLSRSLSAKPMAFIGTFAYSIYLVHAPMIQLLWQYVFVPLQSKPSQMLFALVTVGTIIILAFSYVFFRLCEKPFLSRKKPTSKGDLQQEMSRAAG